MRWCATSVRWTNAPIDQMCQPNCNDQIAARAFGAVEHISPGDYGRMLEYDAVVVTMWKVRESALEPRWMDIAHLLKDAGKIVVLFQEAETAWPLTRSWEEQKSFIQLLQKVDLFLAHNERDLSMWGTFTKSCITWRTCLDISHAIRYRIEPKDKSSNGGGPILFGSSYDQRANGLAGLIACKDLGYPLWHQNRSTGYHDRNAYLPALIDVSIEKEIAHVGWTAWLKEIAGAYIAVHPMPAAAAGRDQIAFAALGIPCIGNAELDVQRNLFGDLCITDLYNPDQIRGMARRLLNDTAFYEFVRDKAISAVTQRYDLRAADDQAQHIKRMLRWE